MSPSPGFTVAGVRCFRSDDDPRTFHFIPGAPSAKPDPRGRPTVTLWASGQGGMLQLEGRWWVDEAQLAALRAALAERFPEDDPASFELTSAPATVGKARLWQGDGGGELEPLAEVTSSGFPPYSAVFMLRLDARQKERVVAALHGREGFLSLSYDVALERPATVAAAVEGEVAEDLAALPPEPSLEECRRRIEAALEAGRLQLTLEADEAAPEALRAEVAAEAREQAAVVLAGMRAAAGPAPTPAPTPAPAAEPGRAHLRARAERSVRVAVEERPSADLASWFAAGQGASHIHVLPGGGRSGPSPG